MLLELDHFSVAYGRRLALCDVTLSMESKALGLLGPNGAGKSTLIRTLLGLLPAYSGRAQIEGLDVRRQGKRIRELVGYMPEHESYLPGMTPVRFLRFMGEMCGLPPSAATERAHEVLFYVGLGEVRYRPIDGLSYGMHQKVRLAQALIHGPKVLILDEPTNGLDPDARKEMLRLIGEMVEHSDSKIVICSHLLKDIETCCRDVLVLKKGQVVASGNIEEMKQTSDNVFELRLKGNVDRFMADLAQIGCQTTLGDHDSFQITTPPDVSPRVFFETAHRHQVQIRHFYARRDTLEDIFLQALLEEDKTGTPSPHPKRKESAVR
jgi:ABC-2 type transport system ATP-binding protein